MLCQVSPEPGVFVAVMASYSGDINGTYGPSSATAPLYISSNCASYCQSCTNSMVGSHWGSQGLLNWISSTWSEADDAASKFAYSNNYAGDGSVNGQLFPKGAFRRLSSACSCLPCKLKGMTTAVLRLRSACFHLFPCSIQCTIQGSVGEARYTESATVPGNLPKSTLAQWAVLAFHSTTVRACLMQDPTTTATACPTARPEPTTPRRATATAVA